MFRGFDLRVGNKYSFSTWKNVGVEEHSQKNLRCFEGLEAYTRRQVIDGKRVSDDWFGAVSADVFLSHSHGDQSLAISIAGFLKEHFGLSCFIDSLVWGNSGKLNRQIDDVYCMSENGTTFDYDKRNYSTSHVHMMLASALTEMIDSCECVIFLNTPKSIDATHSESLGLQVTASPWIYHELMATKFIRERRPSRFGLESRLITEVARIRKDAQDDLQIVYEAPVSHLTQLDTEDLFQWTNCDKAGQDALDYLYEKYPRNRKS